jgi:geranylgeranyl diphosphate synthase type I
MLQEKLKEIKQEVDLFLKEFFVNKKKKIGAVHPEVAKMIEEIENVTLRGGDRFRPFMIWLGAQSASREFTNLRIYEFTNKKEEGKSKNKLIRIMASVELLHSFALIHDDIIDKAELRRGGPTIKPDEKALLAGDLCFVFADELLNDMENNVKEQFDILREEVIAGEWLDVYFTNSKLKTQNSKLKNILNVIYEYKTARYSFLQPFMMGAAFVGVSHGNRLQEILIDIGIAFQMKDDYLDLFGDRRFGKKIGGDLKEGKLTVFHAKLMEKLTDRPGGLSLQKKYEKIFGNLNLSVADVEWVKKIVIELGIKNEIEEEMKRISNEAKGKIEEIKELKGEPRKLLMEMAEFVIQREF